MPGNEPGQVDLFRNGERVGTYNQTTKVYRRVDTDGQLSEPAPFPWASESTPTRVTAAPTEATETDPFALRAAALKEKKNPSPLSRPWAPYAMGGGVSGIILFLRLLLLFARR